MPTKRKASTQKKGKPKNKSMVSRKKAAPIARIVRSVLSKTAERKTYQYAAANQTVTSVVTDTEFVGIVFGPSQGTGQSNRVGNNVKLLSVEIRGHFNSVGSAIALCKVFVGRNKFNIGLPDSTQAQALMQSGNTATALGPGVVSFYRPWNKDAFNVYRSKNLKIGPANGSITNNDFKVMVPFHFKLFPNRVIKFDDTDNTPTNYSLWIAAVGIDPADSGGNPNSVEYHFEAVHTYIDV